MSNQSCDEKQKIVATLCEQYLQKLVSSLKKTHDVNGITDSNETRSIYADEIQLWNQLKKYIETHESVLVNCIHGFYVYILQIFYSLIKEPSVDMYFIKFTVAGDIELKESDKLLLYNIYIRLGDLNRCLKNLKVSRYYYFQACEVDPSRGHAYNQLALVTTAQVFNSLYYSVRALMATEDPISSAKNNIDSLVNRCSLMNPNIEPLFINESSNIDGDRVENWLHFSIIAIYCDKLRIILPYLFKEADKQLTTNENNSTDKIPIPKSDPKWIFAALDVAIDVIMLQPSDEKLISLDLEKEMSDIKGKLSAILKDEIISNREMPPALKHDFLLCGFSPLKDNHKLLDFTTEQPNDHDNFTMLFSRISEKLDKFFTLLAEKKAKNRAKKSRNIALQSILGSKGSS